MSDGVTIPTTILDALQSSDTMRVEHGDRFIFWDKDSGEGRWMLCQQPRYSKTYKILKGTRDEKEAVEWLIWVNVSGRRIAPGVAGEE